MRAAVWLGAILGTVLAPMVHAATPVRIYIHSDNLAKQADAVDAAVQAATTLKPYDDQLAILADFATKEDFAAATLALARRDAEIQYLIDLSPKEPDGRVPGLVLLACARLTTLNPKPPHADKSGAAPTGPCGELSPDPASFKPDQLDLHTLRAWATNNLLYDIADATDRQSSVNDDLATFNRRYPKETAPDCSDPKSNATKIAELVESAKARAQTAANIGDAVDSQRLVNLATYLQTIGNDCRFSASAANRVKEDRLRVSGGSDVTGLVAAAMTSADEAAAAAATKAPPDPLQTKIDQVTADAKTGDLQTLKSFETSIQGALKSLPTAPAQLAALAKIEGDLNQMAAAVGCAGAATCQAGLKGEFSTDASAAIGMLNALASGADAAAGRSNATHWLAAAQAIVAAEKADAQLQVDEKKAADVAAEARYRVRVREVSLLATTVLMATHQSLYDPPKLGALPPDPVYRIDECRLPGTFYCALPYFLASWNEGEAPAQILAWRAVQESRSTNVLRQRAAALGQRNLLLAATATLKAYGDGGVDPNVIAKFLSAFGIVAIAAK